VDDEAEFDAIVRAGAALWNAHKFFECHDKLEEAWRLVKHEKKAETASDPRRDAVHGLILYAAAYVHWSRSNPVGAARKLEDARRAFARTSVRRLARLDLETFRSAVEADLRRATAGDAYEPGRVPSLGQRDPGSA
jgi:predicted metal-dependent hydrolase